MIHSNKSGFTLHSWTSLNTTCLKAGTVSGLNMALHAPAGVNEKEILKNRALLSKELHVDASRWICADQVHGSSSFEVDPGQQGRGALTAASAIPATDALILNQPGLNAMIFTADCLPLILYDTQKKCSALIHAGWKGASQKIVPQVLERMIRELGCSIENMLAAAGPAIDSCCYQVDRPVYESLIAASPQTRDAFSADGPDHWRLSLEKAVFLQLKAQGMKHHQMEGSGMCSCCDEDLYSWRREGAGCGRMASYICT